MPGSGQGNVESSCASRSVAIVKVVQQREHPRAQLPREHNRVAATRSFFVRIEDGWLDTGDFANGDIVAIRTGPRPREGDIVLAHIGEVATLGRLVRNEAGRAHLLAAGASRRLRPVPIGPRTQEARVLGIVVGAIVGTQRTTR